MWKVQLEEKFYLPIILRLLLTPNKSTVTNMTISYLEKNLTN